MIVLVRAYQAIVLATVLLDICLSIALGQMTTKTAMLIWLVGVVVAQLTGVIAIRAGDWLIARDEDRPRPPEHPLL